MRVRGWIVILGAVLLGACSGAKSVARAIPVDVVYSSTHCGGGSVPPAVRRIRDATALRALSSPVLTIDGDALKRLQFDPAELAAVTLLHVDMGERPTAGYTLSVERIEIDAGSVTVQADWNEPAPGMMLAQVITHPCVVVRVAATDVARVRVIDASGRELIPAQNLE